MREKDALSAENAVLTKLADKQQKALASANDLQDSLREQIVSVPSYCESVDERLNWCDSQTAAEKEITMHQQNVRALQDHVASVKREKAELVLRVEQHSKHVAEVSLGDVCRSLIIQADLTQTHHCTQLKAALGERVSQFEAESSARKRAEEQATKFERDLKAAKSAASSSLNALGSGTGGTAEVRQLKEYNDDLQVRRDGQFTVKPMLVYKTDMNVPSLAFQKMLKCSTCAQRFKSVTIVRCGHLFCKECVDARINTRQRKCPSCAIAFDKSDVLPVFF